MVRGTLKMKECKSSDSEFEFVTLHFQSTFDNAWPQPRGHVKISRWHWMMSLSAEWYIHITNTHWECNTDWTDKQTVAKTNEETVKVAKLDDGLYPRRVSTASNSLVEGWRTRWYTASHCYCRLLLLLHQHACCDSRDRQRMRWRRRAQTTGADRRHATSTRARRALVSKQNSVEVGDKADCVRIIRRPVRVCL